MIFLQAVPFISDDTDNLSSAYKLKTIANKVQKSFGRWKFKINIKE